MEEPERIEIILSPAPDDPAENDRRYQAELNEFSRTLRDGGLNVSQRGIAFDSVDAVGYPIGEFSLKLAAIVAPVVAAGLVAWVEKRFGRKITIKCDGVEVTAEKPEDAEHAVERVMKLRKERLQKGRGK